MSSESIAMLRKNYGEDLAKLAEDHLKHDLNEDDRQRLERAGKRLGLMTTVGSFLGLGLGALLALRIRRGRADMFRAFRTAEKPTHVQFADGRTQEIPDISNLLRPSLTGDILTYTIFAAGGLFLGGELGLLAGGASANSIIKSDESSKRRIETAFRGFKADVLRRQADALDKDKSGVLW